MEIREYLEYKENEIRRLYTSVGWTAYTDNMSALKQGFEHSLLVLAAYSKGELVGIVRVVGDGHTIVFIQDLLVRPDNQRQGIGTALLQTVLDCYSDVRQVELVTDNTTGTIEFYRSVGLVAFQELGLCGFMRR